MVLVDVHQTSINRRVLCKQYAWGLFLESPGNVSGRKAIFSSSVSKNGQVYKLETACMRRTSVHIKNMGIKRLYNRKV